MTELARVGYASYDKLHKQRNPEPELNRWTDVSHSTCKPPIQQDGIGKYGPGPQNPMYPSFPSALPPGSSCGPDTGGISGAGSGQIPSPFFKNYTKECAALSRLACQQDELLRYSAKERRLEQD